MKQSNRPLIRSEVIGQAFELTGIRCLPGQFDYLCQQKKLVPIDRILSGRSHFNLFPHEAVTIVANHLEKLMLKKLAKKKRVEQEIKLKTARVLLEEEKEAKR